MLFSGVSQVLQHREIKVSLGILPFRFCWWSICESWPGWNFVSGLDYEATAPYILSPSFLRDRAQHAWPFLLYHPLPLHTTQTGQGGCPCGLPSSLHFRLFSSFPKESALVAVSGLLKWCFLQKFKGDHEVLKQWNSTETGKQETAASNLVLSWCCYLQPGSRCFSLLHPGKT